MRKIMIISVVLVAAAVALWLRGPASRDADDDEARVTSDATQSVAAHRLQQLPAPPPRLPDLPRPAEEERQRPDGWDATIRAAPAESVTMRMPTPGEAAAVRAHRFVVGEQPPPTPSPNPLLPAKQHLSEDELRAGLPAE